MTFVLRLIPEEEALRSLQQAPVSLLSIPEVADAVYSIRSYADGYRLQGGIDQLDRALTMYYLVAETLLGNEIRSHTSEYWYRRETSLCKFGIGMVFAGIKLYKSAEQYLQHAILLFCAAGPLGGAEKCQLQDMATSLTNDVYLKPSDNHNPIVIGSKQLEKAWNLVAWCLALIVEDDKHLELYETMAAAAVARNGDTSNPVSDSNVLAISNMLSSGPNLSRFTQLPESVQDRYCKALDTLYKVLVRLGKHELAVQMYKKIIDRVDETYASVPIDQVALGKFYTMRLNCLRRVLGFCDVTTNSDNAAVTAHRTMLLDFAFSQLKMQGDRSYDTRMECELWGDLLRQRGDLAIALCLYAACFHTHRGGMNRSMKRLSGKINLLMENQELAASLPTLSIPSSVLELPFSSFLRRHGILATSSTLVKCDKLQSVLDESKSFCLDIDSPHRFIHPHTAAPPSSSVSIMLPTPPTPPIPPSVRGADGIDVACKLVQRELNSINELISFLSTKCGILVKDAQKFANRLLRSQGIFNLNMLVSFLKMKGRYGLDAVINHTASVNAISAATMAGGEVPVPSDELLITEEESALIKELADRLGLAVGSQDYSNLVELYTCMVSGGHMLCFIALGFCEHTATSLCTVSVDRLRQDVSSFKVEDSAVLLAADSERSLAASAIALAWQFFIRHISTQNNEVKEIAGAPDGSTSSPSKNSNSPPPTSESFPSSSSQSSSEGQQAHHLSQSVAMWAAAADQGSADAQCSLGNCFYYAQGIDQDYSQAAQWYRKAADQGHDEAQNHLGYCYQYGQGVAKDENEAVSWYRKAAIQGHANAQNHLGYCYHHGRGVPKNPNQAFIWYKKSAEQGYVNAENSLGDCYQSGRGVPADTGKAMYWYEMAAKQGHAHAQYNLGLFYKYGRGVAKNPAIASGWLTKAAEQGYERAKGEIKRSTS